MDDSSGKVAVVTGAASGIGAALVRRLQRGGAAVVAADRDAAGHGVRVSVVVPGVVDTAIFDKARDLTGVDYGKRLDKLPFGRITPDRAASEILAGVERNRQFIAFPRYNRVIWRLNRLVPDLMSGVINK